MTYIYGIFHEDKGNNKCMYIGRTNREPIERFNEHKQAIDKRVHSVKALNKLEADELSFCVLYQADTDNSLIGFILEACANSIYKPKNKIVEQQGRRFTVFARIDENTANEIIKLLAN